MRLTRELRAAMRDLRVQMALGSVRVWMMVVPGGHVRDVLASRGHNCGGHVQMELTDEADRCLATSPFAVYVPDLPCEPMAWERMGKRTRRQAAQLWLDVLNREGNAVVQRASRATS